MGLLFMQSLEMERLRKENEILKGQQEECLPRFERIFLDRLKENLKRKYDLKNIYENFDINDGISLELEFKKTYHIIGLRIPYEILESEADSFYMCDRLINKEIMSRYLKEV